MESMLRELAISSSRYWYIMSEMPSRDNKRQILPTSYAMFRDCNASTSFTRRILHLDSASQPLDASLAVLRRFRVPSWPPLASRFPLPSADPQLCRFMRDSLLVCSQPTLLAPPRSPVQTTSRSPTRTAPTNLSGKHQSSLSTISPESSSSECIKHKKKRPISKAGRRPFVTTKPCIQIRSSRAC